jgi:hypothetical protein
MMMTTLNRAHVAGQARLRVACPAEARTWRSARPSYAGIGYAHANPAGDMAANPVFMVKTTTTKRPARHLTVRTT